MGSDTWTCGTPIHLASPVSINVDLAAMAASGGKLRISTWDGYLLQDHEVVPEQHRLLKLVFMKHADLSASDMRMVNAFAQQPCATLKVNMKAYGIELVAKLVFEGGERQNHILGIFYQHRNTKYHCELKIRSGSSRG